MINFFYNIGPRLFPYRVPLLVFAFAEAILLAANFTSQIRFGEKTTLLILCVFLATLLLFVTGEFFRAPPAQLNTEANLRERISYKIRLLLLRGLALILIGLAIAIGYLGYHAGHIN